MRRFVIKTEKDLKIFLSKFNKKVFAFDTETTSLRYTELEIEGFSLCSGDISCYVFLADYENKIINEEHNALVSLLGDLVKNAEVLIGHNLVYDLKVLDKIGISFDKEPELFDTMVADHLINENRKHGLKFLAKELLGVDEVTAFTDIKDHSSSEFFKYACHDAEWTYQLAMLHKPELEEQGLTKLFREIEMPFLWSLLDMQITGMLVDVDKVRKTAEEIRVAIQKLALDMCDLLELRYEIGYDEEGELTVFPYTNFNSSQQLAEILFTRLKLPMTETTPSGAPAVGKEVIARLRKSHPFVELLHKYKVASKLYNSYFKEDAQIMINLEMDNRVRPSFHDTGTATGRLSCSNPNLQQLPKVNKDFPIQARSAFIVPEGYSMVTCDYSGQELRVLAEISQEPVLIDTFNKGKDMHLSTANDFFDLKIPEEALYESSKEHSVYKAKFKAERNKAKTINFGMAYGKGAYGFAKDFNISEEEAQEILDKYFAALPGVKQSIDDCHERVRTDGYVNTMTGRRRRFTKSSWGKYDKKAFRQSFNFLIQGYSADMMRLAMNAGRALIKSNPKWDAKPIATVHDEAVYEVKTEYSEEFAAAIKKAFEGITKFSIPIVAETDIGLNYAEAK